MSKLSKVETVFVATDFSQTADTAIEWAARLARPHGARIILFHGVPAPAPPLLSPTPDALCTGVFEQDLERATGRLEKTAEGLRRRSLTVEIDVQADLGATTILQRAAAFGADLLVAGTRGHSLRKAILGSTATQLVRNASVPVLVVPRGAGIPNTHLQRVLVPTDFAGDVRETLQTLETLLGAAAVGTDVTLLHVHRAAYQPASPWSAPLILSPRTPTATAARRRLEQTAERLAHCLRSVDAVTCGGETARAIGREADLLHADLIVMSHGHKSLSRLLRASTTERVLATTHCPVLTYRREGTQNAQAHIPPPREQTFDACSGAAS